MKKYRIINKLFFKFYTFLALQNKLIFLFKFKLYSHFNYLQMNNINFNLY